MESEQPLAKDDLDLNLAKLSDGLSAGLVELLLPIIEDLGFELVRIQLLGSERKTLQIMAERPDGSMSIDDCADLSRAISAYLEVEDPIAGAYVLEVSSPGIDRPLTRLKDFVTYAGELARVDLEVPIEGRRRFKGQIIGVEGEAVCLDLDQEEAELKVSFRDIARAKLVLTDALLRAEQAGKRELTEVEDEDG